MTLYLIAAAHLADLWTALTRPADNLEIHPIGQAVLQDPLAGITLKLALILLVVAIVWRLRTIDRRITLIVTAFAIAAGLTGAWSNL